MRWLLILFLVGMTTRAAADSCPAAPDTSAKIAPLMADLQDAPTQNSAYAIMSDLWLIWMTAPDAAAQDMLDAGIAKRESYDLLGARDLFDALVEYCPDYAEGYNQRAFVSFLRQDFAAALYDADQTLALNPDHLGALSGKALTLMGLGRQDEAQVVLRRAVALNPWLKERSLLVPIPGQDI